MGVVNNADQRLLLGDLGEQTQDGQADEESIRRIAGPQTERCAERLVLRRRQPVEPIKERRAYLMQPGERQFHLGLDACGPRHTAAGGTSEEVIEEGGLARTGFTVEHDHTARPGSRVLDEPIERLTLAAPVLQP